MPQLPLNTKPYFSADKYAIGTNEPDDLFNLVFETAQGGIVNKRRFGYTEFTDLGTDQQGDGLFYWTAKDKLIAVSGGNIYTVDKNGVVRSITTARLAERVPVIFSAGQDVAGDPWLYMANGALVYSDNGANTTAPTGTVPPVTATHVVFINGRYLANWPGTNRFSFTDTNPGTGAFDNAYWDAVENPLTCDAKGDILTSMLVFGQEIYNWGAEGLEIWHDDGVTPFSPSQGSFIDIGLEAPRSVAQLDNTVFALCVTDNKRVVLRFTNRQPNLISGPIESVLATYTTVSDAIGQCIAVGGHALYVLKFPTEGKTWVYDFKNDIWCQWGYWNSDEGVMENYRGQHSCYVRSWNKHFIMSDRDGKIYELSDSVYQDDGEYINAYRRTPWLDHQLPVNKRSDKLTIITRRGITDGTMMVRYADNGVYDWSNYMHCALGGVGDSDHIISLSSLGSFESRKYEFRCVDNCYWALLGAIENLKAYLR